MVDLKMLHIQMHLILLHHDLQGKDNLKLIKGQILNIKLSLKENLLLSNPMFKIVRILFRVISLSFSFKVGSPFSFTKS